MNNSDSNLYHSGARLRKLRELQGVDEVEFTRELKITYEELMIWESQGIPDDEFVAILDYFGINIGLFDIPVSNNSELNSLIQSHLFPQEIITQAVKKISANKKSKDKSLDLSGLNLYQIPDEVFTLTWLETLNLSDNNIDFISSHLILLEQLKSINITNNPLNATALFHNYKYEIKVIDYTRNMNSNIPLLEVEKLCTFVIDNQSSNQLAIIDKLRATIDARTPITICKLDDLHDMTINALNISYFIFTGDYQACEYGLEIAKIKKTPWLHYNASKNDDTDLYESFKSHPLYFRINDKNFTSILNKISYQGDIPIVKLMSLEIYNIGVYEELLINLHRNLTVLVGVNGSGKSTVLKAISLGILGPKKANIDFDSSSDLLRILGTKDKKIVYNPTGKIILTAMIDGVIHKNTIKLEYNKNTGNVDIKGEHFPALFNNEKLTNLILGINERRNTNSKKTRPQIEEDLSPKPMDLLPIASNHEQPYLNDFSIWLGGLALNVLNGENKQQEIIDTCFNVFSEFMGESIQYKDITSLNPITLWIEHQNPKQTIPLRLASQGYQSVMGWVGFIIQRMFEAYSDSLQPFNQSSIIIIDEIDQLLSVKWQQKILHVLSEIFFPNTQWIISSHSPIVLTDLDKDQVILLHKKNGCLVAESSKVDLWMWQYGDIIRNFFEVPPLEPKARESEIKRLITKLEDSLALDACESKQAELDKLYAKLEKTKESRAYVDVLYAEQQKLQKRERELSNMINTLSSSDPKA